MTGRVREPRPYPLDRLAIRLGIPTDDPAYYDRLARRLGVNRSNVIRARSAGLTDRQADTWAIRAGLMPHQVWPRWRDSVLLHGVALINANRDRCPCGQPYDRVDSRGWRYHTVCLRERVARFREKMQATGHVTSGREAS